MCDENLLNIKKKNVCGDGNDRVVVEMTMN